jgi:hypothetical protein
MRGGDGKTGGSGPPWLPDHNASRLSRLDGPVSYHNCRFFANGDWLSNVANNPSIRLNNGGGTAAKINLDRIYSEASSIEFGDNQGDGFTQDALVDKVYILSTGSTDGIGAGCAGNTFRNVVCVQPNSIPQGPRASTHMVSQGLRNDVNVRDDAFGNPFDVYSCTFVNLRNDANLVGTNLVTQNFSIEPDGPVLNADQPFPLFASANHVTHAPNLSPERGGTAMFAPLSLVSAGAPYYLGPRVYSSVEIEYSYGSLELNGRDEFQLTGETSGATGKLIHNIRRVSGNFGAGTAAGFTIIFQGFAYTGVAFQAGERVLHRGEPIFTIVALTSYITGPFSRFAFDPADAAIYRPVNDPGGSGVSLAVGNADMTKKVAIDDFFGTVRPGFIDPETGQITPGTPSRGAMEPA